MSERYTARPLHVGMSQESLIAALRETMEALERADAALAASEQRRRFGDSLTAGEPWPTSLSNVQSGQLLKITSAGDLVALPPTAPDTLIGFQFTGTPTVKRTPALRLQSDFTPTSEDSTLWLVSKGDHYVEAGRANSNGTNGSIRVSSETRVDTTDDTTGVTTGLAFGGLAPGVYIISGTLGYLTDAIGTAPHFSLQQIVGVAASSCLLQETHSTGAVTAQTCDALGFGTWTNGSAGSVTERPVRILARVVLTSGGTLALFIRSNLLGAQVSFMRGSLELIKVG